jgi:hypothetical protein
MNLKKGLLLFWLLVTTATVISCKKEKSVAPPAAKTVADYIRQMVGTHKMVGQSDYRSPGLDTVIAISESWIIDSPGESSFSVKSATLGENIWHLKSNDTAYNRLVFRRYSTAFEYEYVDYYYITDSIEYWGYNKTSMTTYKITMHSEK